MAFDPSKFKMSPVDPWRNTHRNALNEALIVMNALKFDRAMMREFKDGVKFSAVVQNQFGANINHRCDSRSTKAALDYINEGNHEKWQKAKIHIDTDGDKRTRCYLMAKGADKWTHYLTVREPGKVTLVEV